MPWELEITCEMLNCIRPKTKIVVTKALMAIKKGQLVKCSQIEYESDVRAALQQFAGEMIDQGQDIYAQLALEEVRRLDREFGEDVR